MGVWDLVSLQKRATVSIDPDPLALAALAAAPAFATTDGAEPPSLALVEPPPTEPHWCMQISRCGQLAVLDSQPGDVLGLYECASWERIWLSEPGAERIAMPRL